MKRHTEKITFLSRNGLLPKVQGPAFDYQLKYVNKENIDRLLSESDDNSISFDQVKRLYMDEVEGAAGNKINWLDVFNPRGLLTRSLRWISQGQNQVLSHIRQH
jgi:uncharacterized NAD(P)/FAD-binding protein YdhS